MRVSGDVSRFSSLSNPTAVEVCEEKGYRAAYFDFVKAGLPVGILTLIAGVLLVVMM